SSDLRRSTAPSPGCTRTAPPRNSSTSGSARPAWTWSPPSPSSRAAADPPPSRPGLALHRRQERLPFGGGEFEVSEVAVLSIPDESFVSRFASFEAVLVRSAAVSGLVPCVVKHGSAFPILPEPAGEIRAVKARWPARR